METPGPPPNADDGTARATAHFAARPDAELFYLAQHAARYPPAVGAAAVAELQRRALVPVPAAPAGPPPAPPMPATGWGPALRTLQAALSALQAWCPCRRCCSCSSLRGLGAPAGAAAADPAV